jgi:hypothetical protein
MKSSEYRMSAREIGGMGSRGRVLIVENSLSLGNGYRDCAVVFDGDPDDAAARWECQAGESPDAFIGRVQGDLTREGRASEEVVIHTVTGFWERRGALG